MGKDGSLERTAIFQKVWRCISAKADGRSDKGPDNGKGQVM